MAATTEWAFCTYFSHGAISAILDGKRMWHPPLGHRKQRQVELDGLEFLCVRICYIRLPSSTADFSMVSAKGPLQGSQQTKRYIANTH